MAIQATPTGFHPATPGRYTEAVPTAKLNTDTFTSIAAPAVVTQTAPSTRK